MNDGIVESIVHISDAGDDMQIEDGMILPGFINAHCHTELSHLHKIIPKRTGLVDFVSQVMKLRFVEPGKDGYLVYRDPGGRMHTQGTLRMKCYETVTLRSSTGHAVCPFLPHVGLG